MYQTIKVLLETQPNATLLIKANGDVICANTRAAQWLGVDMNNLTKCSLSSLTTLSPNEIAENSRVWLSSSNPVPIKIDFKSELGHTLTTVSNGQRIVLPELTQEKTILVTVQPRETVTKNFHSLNEKITQLKKEIILRKNIENELRETQDNLQELVEERTSELRQAQAELLRNERLSTLGQLTATVSHELRNPLGAMLSSVYMIRKLVNFDDEKLKRAIERLERNISRCDYIIDELLDFTRISTLKLEQHHLDEWVDNFLDEYSITKDINLVREPGVSKNIYFDSHRMRRAMINILDNACHSMQNESTNSSNNGSTLTVSTQVRDNIEIVIRDNGVGISSAVMEKMFEPLYSTKGFGVGLGLPIVKQIMELHQGGIQVKSEEGKGTEITLWIPTSIAS